jgi:hypothetical protein
VSDEREDVSPHRRVLASAVVENHDATGFDLVDVITDRARRLPCWPVEDRERPAGHAEAWIERLDVQTLPRDAESIQRVTDRRRVKPGRAFKILVVHASGFSVLCSCSVSRFGSEFMVRVHRSASGLAGQHRASNREE